MSVLFYKVGIRGFDFEVKDRMYGRGGYWVRRWVVFKVWVIRCGFFFFGLVFGYWSWGGFDIWFWGLDCGGWREKKFFVWYNFDNVYIYFIIFIFVYYFIVVLCFFFVILILNDIVLNICMGCGFCMLCFCF